jgi:hypothetical protein
MATTKEAHKLYVQVSPEVGETFRRYVFNKTGSTHQSGKFLEEALREYLEKRGQKIMRSKDLSGD